MSGTFSSYTFNFNTLLGRSSFPNLTIKEIKVPPFQRGYSWEKNHVATFWEDVWSFHNNANIDDTYFLGPIVIMPANEKITLLDGQQRLATTTILLSAIRDLAREFGGQKGSDLARDIQRDNIWIDEEAQSFALNLNNNDSGYFTDSILFDPPHNDEKIKLRSHRLINNAKKLLSKNIKENFPIENPLDLVQKLKQFVITIVQRLKLVVIEVGSELEAYQIFETLNDRGLRLSVPDLLLNFLMQNASNQTNRDRVRENWDKLIEITGSGRISVFLRHMWISKYGDVKAQSLYREIRTHIQNKGITSLSFSKNAADECSDYSDIIEVKNLSKKSSAYIDAIVNNFSAERCYPLLLAGKIHLDQNEFEKLSEITLAIFVRHSVIANLNPSQLEDVLFSTAFLITKEKNNDKSSKAILNLVRDNLRNINPTKEQIKRGLADLYLNKKQAQYILREIATKMQSSKNIFKADNFTIEHIYPQNADEDKWPKKIILDPYVWHIGNLTLLEKSLNKDIGNESYQFKKEAYLKSDFIISNSISNGYEVWDLETIINRSEFFTKLIDQIWKI